MDLFSGILSIGSLIQGLLSGGKQDEAAGMSRERLEMMKRATDYLFKRQEQVDPIFKGMLSQGLLRSASVPRIAGAYGKRRVPLMAGNRGYRAQLPVPKLIGAEKELPPLKW